MTEEVKQLILQAKNICLIPSESEPESISATLALFYTLKDLGKNVNVVAGSIPEKLQFLIPSLESISQPQHFVISIARSLADISQIHYEKNEEHLKIHLTVDKGQLKREHIDLYATQAKPDLVITVGIQNFQSQLAGRLDSFGFLLDAPILNIDNNIENLKFGKINIIEEKSFSEIVLQLIKELNDNGINKNNANCLLAGLVMYYENFKNTTTRPEVFEMTGMLIKKGAEHHKITEHLYKMTDREVQFLGNILSTIKINESRAVAVLTSEDFREFGEPEAELVVGKMKDLGIQQDVVALWHGHASSPIMKGFFYSRKPALINKFAERGGSTIKNGWVFLIVPGQDIEGAKNNLLTII